MRANGTCVRMAVAVGALLIAGCGAARTPSAPAPEGPAVDAGVLPDGAPDHGVADHVRDDGSAVTACADDAADAGTVSAEPTTEATTAEPTTEATTAEVEQWERYPAGAAATLPRAWRACRGDSQCTVIGVGCCDRIAVAARHAARARKRLPVSPCDMLCDFRSYKAGCRNGLCTLYGKDMAVQR